MIVRENDSVLSKFHRIFFLSHADTDLHVFREACQKLEARSLDGLFDDLVENLEYKVAKLEQSDTCGLVELLSASQVGEFPVIILRVLGDLSQVSFLDSLKAACIRSGARLLITSGTGELSFEHLGHSTVSSELVEAVDSYFFCGGSTNFLNGIKKILVSVTDSTMTVEPPRILPLYGIYDPDFDADPANNSGFFSSSSEWQEKYKTDKPAIGIAFYRAHWLSGNLDFVNSLILELQGEGFNTLPVFTSSLKDPEAYRLFIDENCQSLINVLINTTSFASYDLLPMLRALSPGSAGLASVPVVQAITSSMSYENWRQSIRGLNPIDAAMNVVLPEFDGRIISVPVSFKEKLEEGSTELSVYSPWLPGIRRVVSMVSSLTRLRSLPNRHKKIAFILTNSGAKADQIGNAVGLDTPASLHRVLKAMRSSGYRIEGVPGTSDEIIHDLIARGTYDHDLLTEEQCHKAIGRVSAEEYSAWFDTLPESIRRDIVSQWGSPPGQAFLHRDELVFAGIEYGNCIVVLQPPRGYGIDPDLIYHRPDLPPTHHYLALYHWLVRAWGADALVHFGKHGTLEWLPGKGVGLSENCFPDAILNGAPLIYPFIINDPGEGAQAKRRGHAVVIDHLTPPMMTADTYGPLLELTQLVSEYYQVELLDPEKLPLLRQRIWELIKAVDLDKDLGLISPRVMSEVGETDSSPLDLELPATKVDQLICDIDAYLCELGRAQIRDGLHIFARVPEGEHELEMLQSMTRLPNGSVPSLEAAIAAWLNLDYELFLSEPTEKLSPFEVRVLTGFAAFSRADALRAITTTAKIIIEQLAAIDFCSQSLDAVLEETARLTAVEASGGKLDLLSCLEFICLELRPKLQATSREEDSLLDALEGRLVEPGPSGSPTRGMVSILPTGRNFYSVDPRAVPSSSAWKVGRQLADELLKKHIRDTGGYPESIAITTWGTSTMRTYGDDLAQILCLLGVKPVWQKENQRVVDVELIPIGELGRPRIDVTVRISGFFRDAFPELINLLNKAFLLVIGSDKETDEQNFVRKHYLTDVQEGLSAGLLKEEAAKFASYRVYGSKPGTYGAGILPLIQERNWSNLEDFSRAYLSWGGYAYDSEAAGVEARQSFCRNLTRVEVAVQNQDNREHDIFDSDDYFQYHGGLIATINVLSGKAPGAYFGDSQDPERARVSDLKQEALKVFRTRVVNPKWLESIRKHGYKGGLEISATVDYIFGYDATAGVVDDWMYDTIGREYVLDQSMREFFEESNPWALKSIVERMVEAASRGMWASPDKEVYDSMLSVYEQIDASLESRQDAPLEASGPGGDRV